MVLSVLLAIASRQHHESTDDADLYRFPPILINTLRFGVCVQPLLALVIYKSFGRHLEMYEIAVLVFIYCSWTLIVAAQLWVVSRYTLELRVGSLTVNDWRGRRVTPIDDIRKVSVARPWRGRGYIDVFDGSGKRRERIDAGLQDFDEVADFILNQCTRGTVVREKVPGESWSQRFI
jgi:hypothetical protein